MNSMSWLFTIFCDSFVFHSLYFNDKNQITEEEFKRIYKQSTQYETQFFMDIDNLSYDELMKIAEVYIKEQNDN